MIAPKRFDISLLTGGYSEGLDAFKVFKEDLNASRSSEQPPVEKCRNVHQPRTLPLARYVILSWVESFPYAKRVEMVPNQVMGEKVLDGGGKFILGGIFGSHT